MRTSSVSIIWVLTVSLVVSTFCHNLTYAQGTPKTALEIDLKRKEVQLLRIYRYVVGEYETRFKREIKKANWSSELRNVGSVDKEFQQYLRKIERIKYEGLYHKILDVPKPKIFTSQYIDSIQQQGLDLVYLQRNIEVFYKSKTEKSVNEGLLSIENGSRVAEIGSGFNDFASEIFTNRKRVIFYGVELDSNAVRLTHEYYQLDTALLAKQNVFYGVNSTEKSTNIEDKNVDYVIMRLAFHHFNYPRTMLRSIKKSCHADTKILVYEQFEPFFNVFEEICEYAMNKKELVQLFRDEGFTVQEFKKVSPAYFFVSFALAN